MGEMVSFKSNGKETQGYLAIPSSGRGKGVVVIQEWWGLVPHIKDVADRFTAAGFVALAPDLYHGQAASNQEPDVAGKLMMSLKISEADKDLAGAIDFLSKHDSVMSKKVGTVGFCMGGALSLFAAANNPDKVGACVVFYGVHAFVMGEVERLQAPVLGLYAEHDDITKPEAIDQLQKDFEKHGKQIEVKIYPGTHHAFFNDTRPQVYNREAAADAWKRTVEFLDKNLS